MEPSNNPSAAAIAAVFALQERPVWVVTAAAGERRGGLLATWVSQAALDPSQPTAVIALAPNHATCELVEAAGGFGLHLLRSDQLELALRFCLGSSRQIDKLAGLDTIEGQSGAPLLTDCLARLDCRVYARLATGDRTYFWADVLAGGPLGEGAPLTDQQLFAAAAPAQLKQLAADRDHDIALHRTLAAEWRSQLPPFLAPRADR